MLLISNDQSSLRVFEAVSFEAAFDPESLQGNYSKI
jgi:hypothetical protein